MHAFAGSGLKTIKLFGEVTSIDEYAFADCFSLTDFYCYSDNSPQTEENVFANVDLNKVNLHVPCNRKDAYTGADYWKDFGHIFTTDEVKQDGLWYRLDDNTWEDAINQMHRYRDAIYYKDYDANALKKEVIGGYILFPGDGEPNDVAVSKSYKTIKEVNIGAFPLRPKDVENRKLLENFIDELIHTKSYETIAHVIPQKVRM